MSTQTVSSALEEVKSSAVSAAWSRKEHFAAVLPNHIETKGFLGLAAGALYRDRTLMQAANNSPQTFINVLMRCATLGHQPGTEEFYLIPRKVDGRAVVQGIEGYRGIIERMYRSGAVASVVVREVCENDSFTFVEGVDEKPQHTVDWFGGKRGKMIGVYAYAVLTTGAVSRVVILSEADVMAAKASSDGATSKYSPWNREDGGPGHPELKGRSMWWKTAARRLEPWVPTSAEYRREQLRAAAEAVANTHGPAPTHDQVDMETGEIVDAEFTDEPTEPEPEQ